MIEEEEAEMAEEEEFDPEVLDAVWENQMMMEDLGDAVEGMQDDLAYLMDELYHEGPDEEWEDEEYHEDSDSD